MSKKKTTIVARRKADEHHEVLSTLVEGDTAHRRTPCAECPWRRDAPLGAFPAEAYRLSAKTAYDMSRSRFGCHMSGVSEKTGTVTCAGFLLRGADHNLSVRLAIMTGELDPRKISDGGLALYDDYREMAEANGVEPDDPALGPVRTAFRGQDIGPEESAGEAPSASGDEEGGADRKRRAAPSRPASPPTKVSRRGSRSSRTVRAKD